MRGIIASSLIVLAGLWAAPGAGTAGPSPRPSAARAPYDSKKSIRAPRVFAEGTVSTQDDELGGTFSPGGTEFYFAKRTPSTIVSNSVVICATRFVNGSWESPRIAPFSGNGIDFGPSISPDGSRLYFASVRAAPSKPQADTDIWFVERLADGSWSEPRSIGEPINSTGPDQTACAASDGTIYFASVRTGGMGGFDIYRSRLSDGRYQEPENLGSAINSEASELQPYIAPDQSYLVFASIGRADAAIAGGSPYPRPDLYVSVNRDGTWTPATRLPAPINTEASEAYPSVSPDGRYLFFTSERNFASIPMRRRLGYDELERRLHRTGNGLGDVYQVDVSALGIDGILESAQ